MKQLVGAGILLAVVLQFPIGAQEAARPSSQIDALKRLTFRNIGPTNQAGRVSVIVGIPGDPYTMYVSGAPLIANEAPTAPEGSKTFG